MADGRIDGQDLIGEGVFQTFDRLDKTVIDQIKRINDLESAIRNALGGRSVGSSADALGDAVKKSNTALTEQEKVLREINRIRERNTQVSQESLKQLVKERATRSQITKALKDEVIASGQLGRSYSQLRKQRDLAANTLRDLIVSEKASNRELRNAQKEFDRLNTKIRRADAAIGNFRDNVGNYGSAVQGVVGFSRQLLGAFGVFSVIQIGQELFEQVKALDALKFGLQEVTESQLEFNQAQQFLDEIADRAGADILGLTKRYVNFLAAAKTTTLTLKQTQEVFENVVVASGLLGRSTDDTNGALRALEQILSKGKVQAEELRGQLGERLPGAFQILEKALGLATGELNELLEVGGLLSVDAIPALAQGLEDTFGLDQIERVDTLAASQARLSAEFTKFIREMETGGGVISTTFQALFDGLAGALALIREINSAGSEQSEQQGLLAGAAVAIEAVQQEAERNNITLKEAAEDLLPRYNKILQEYGKSLSDITKAQSSSAVKNAFNFVTGTFREQNAAAADAVRGVNLYKTAIEQLEAIAQTGELPEEEVNEPLEKQVGILEELREKLKLLREEREKADDVSDIKRLNVEIKNTDDEIRRLTDTFKEAKKKREEFIGDESIVFAKNLVKEFKKARLEVNVGSAAWKEYGRQIQEAEAALKSLQDTADILDGNLDSLGLPDTEELFEEVDSFLNGQGLDILLAELANKLKVSKEEVIAEYESIYGRDFEKFKEYEEAKLKQLKLIERQKLEVRKNSLNLVEALSDAFLEIGLQKLDQEQDRAEEAYNAIADANGVSEEQKEAAAKKRDEAEKKIEEQRAKREKQAFLFRQALSVADIFIADGVARANAVASTAAIVPYLPLGAATLATLQGLITANTAISLGTVLAQSLPAFFFKGKELGNSFAGDAVWGEIQREVKVGADGGLEVSPDGPSMTTVKSSDIIHKSMGDFIRSLGVNNSATAKRIRGGAKRTSNQNLRILTGGNREKSSFDHTAIVDAVRLGFRRAGIKVAFNVQNGSRITKLP